jgi:hypothetical protein
MIVAASPEARTATVRWLPVLGGVRTAGASTMNRADTANAEEAEEEVFLRESVLLPVMSAMMISSGCL